MASPRFEHVAPQGENLIIITGIRALGRRIEHVAENKFSDFPIKAFRLRPGPKAALNPWAVAGLPVLGSFQSPRRCIRRIA